MEVPDGMFQSVVAQADFFMVVPVMFVRLCFVLFLSPEYYLNEHLRYTGTL